MKLFRQSNAKENGVEPAEPSVTPAEKAELAAIRRVHAHTMDRADRAIRVAMEQAGKGAFGTHRANQGRT